MGVSDGAGDGASVGTAVGVAVDVVVAVGITVDVTVKVGVQSAATAVWAVTVWVAICSWLGPQPAVSAITSRSVR